MSTTTCDEPVNHRTERHTAARVCLTIGSTIARGLAVSGLLATTRDNG